MPIESVTPSSQLILPRPLLLLPPIPPSIRVFYNESTLRMRWPKYWSFSFNISPSNEHPGLISFRKDKSFIESSVTHHAICPGGRHLFAHVPMGSREGKSLSKVTQQGYGSAESVCPPSSLFSPQATFKEQGNDHGTQKKPRWAALLALDADHWRILGDSSASLGPAVPRGRGQETQWRQEGRVHRTSIYF